MMKKIILFLLLIPATCFGWANSANLVFQDRFNGDLSAWTEVETGGTVAIQARDDSSFFSPKMKLNDTSASDLISATHSFTEPATTYIIEYDGKIVTDGDICEMQLLDASDNVIISVNIGSTNDTATFDTDGVTTSTISWPNNTYKQAVVSVNPVANTVSCYVSEPDATYGSLDQIGAAKAYSGTAVTKIRFTTSTGTSVAYIDEVRIYTADLAIIGDSISDGKPFWSTHPEYPGGRLAAAEDETSPPTYQLSLLLGSSTTSWVGNRGFGGSYVSDVDSYIQIMIDQGFTRFILEPGHNSLMDGIALATIEASYESIIDTLQASGVTGRNIIICNIIPSAYLDDSAAENQYRQDFNEWLRNTARAEGATFVDNDKRLRNPAATNSLLAAYDDTDGTHLVAAGSAVMADNIFDAINAVEQVDSDNGDNTLYPADCQSGCVMYPNNYDVVCGGNEATATALIGFF